LLSEVSEDEDKDEDDDSSAMITGNLFAHGSGVGGGGGDDEYGGEEGDGEDDLYFPNPDDADSVPDAEVNKYSFLKHLCHYMEGNKISNANRKCVEWTIPFEVGTLVRTMDTLRTADMKDRVFDKYVNKIRDIEDRLGAHKDAAHRFKAGKQDLCSRNLLRKWKSETVDF
jgi:hypothetical protein